MRRTMIWFVLAGIVSTMGASAGRAEVSPSSGIDEDAMDFSDLVVTASRTPERIGEVGSSVTVITSEEIARRKENSVLELLRSVPGVYVTTSGGAGTTSSIRIRGANDVHTLVLVDGIRFHSNTLGTASIQNLTLDNIDRIEIVRGPQSVLYGSDAMGGVIQIFTKRGDENRTSIAYEGGAYGTNQARVSTMGTSERQSYSIAGSWLESDGYSRFDENLGATEDDRYRNKSASVSWNRRGWLDLGATLLFSEGTIDIDAPGTATPDNRTRFSRNREVAATFDFARQFGERWRHRLNLSGFEDEQDGNGGTFFDITSVTKAAKWQSEYRWNDAFRLVGGLSSEKQEGESIQNATRFSRSYITNSAFLEGMLHWRDRLHVTLGGRHDNHSTFGEHETWRATASWDARPRTRIYGSYGTGFKAPTFNQLFFPGIGTPTLQPEESKGWDVGAEHRFGERATLRATYFHNEFENLIQFVAPTFQARNTARASSDGVEVEGELRITPRLLLDAAYTYTEARDDVSHLFLQRVAGDVFTAHLAWTPYDPLTLDLYYRNVGPAFSATNEGNRTDGFDVLSAVAAYRWRERHKVWVRGENVLDRQYEEVIPFGTPGASVYGGYEFTF